MTHNIISTIAFTLIPFLHDSLFLQSEKKGSLSMALENVKLMHEYYSAHLEDFILNEE